MQYYRSQETRFFETIARDSPQQEGFNLVKRRQVFITHSERIGEDIIFSSRNSHYLAHVLRLRVGDVLTARDAEHWYTVIIAEIRAGRIYGKVTCIEPITLAQTPEIELAVACIRPGPFEEILRHGTELGVTRFIPILTSRTIRKPSHKKNRWEFIVASATCQCKRSVAPIIEPPLPLATFLELERSTDLCILLTLQPDSRSLLSLLEETSPRSLLFLIGPEGGFAETEETEARSRGFIPAGLGPLILRTETASLAVIAATLAWSHYRYLSS